MPDKVNKRLICHAQALHQNLTPMLMAQTKLSPSDVHKLRVTVKELRALWQVVKPFLAKGQANVACRDIGRAAKLLADIRDQHVQMTTLDRCLENATTDELPALRRVRDQLQAQVGRRPEAVMTTAIAALFAQDLDRWQSLELAGDRHGMYDQGYQRLYRKARKHYLQAKTGADAEDWHRLRRWTKYLALVTPVIREDGAANIEANHYRDLAEKLGDLHDLAVLRAGLRSLPGPDRSSTRCAHDLVENRAESLQRMCCRKASRLFSAATDQRIPPGMS